MRCERCGEVLVKDDVEVHVNEERFPSWNCVRVFARCPRCGHEEEIY